MAFKFLFDEGGVFLWRISYRFRILFLEVEGNLGKGEVVGRGMLMREKIRRFCFVGIGFYVYILRVSKIFKSIYFLSDC